MADDALPLLTFADAASFERWLEEHGHSLAPLRQEGQRQGGCAREAAPWPRQAKADGRWAAAYARQSEAAPDPDLAAALDAEPAARELFRALDAANRFAILFRVQQAGTSASEPPRSSRWSLCLAVARPFILARRSEAASVAKTNRPKRRGRFHSGRRASCREDEFTRARGGPAARLEF